MLYIVYRKKLFRFVWGLTMELTKVQSQVSSIRKTQDVQDMF